MDTPTGVYTVILYSVSLIVAIRSPPQVLDPVVITIPVYVVNLWLIIRVRYITFGYKTVN